MNNLRKNFTVEFKKYISSLIPRSYKNITEIRKVLDIKRSTYDKWMSKEFHNIPNPFFWKKICSLSVPPNKKLQDLYNQIKGTSIMTEIIYASDEDIEFYKKFKKLSNKKKDHLIKYIDFLDSQPD